MDFLLQVENHFTLFALTLARILTFLWIVPPFGMRPVLVQIRIAAALILAVLFCQVQGWSGAAFPDGSAFLLLLAKEVLIGGMLGFLVSLVFVGLLLAGELVAQQMGLDWQGDAEEEEEEGQWNWSSFLYLFGVLAFVLMDGHHNAFQLLNQSFQAFPVGQFAMTSSLLSHLAVFFRTVFILALKVAIPAVSAFFLASFVLMVVSRTMPQVNAFLFSLPIRVVIGVCVMVISLPVVVFVLQDSVNGWGQTLSWFFAH